MVKERTEMPVLSPEERIPEIEFIVIVYEKTEQ